MSAAVTTLLNDPRARAEALLAAWDAQGPHRTATRGDERGALWLVREASGFGAHVAREEFALDRLDPVACYLEFDGRRIPAVPVFDAPSTGAGGTSGRLSLVSHDGAVLVTELTPRSVYSGEFERLRRGDPHRAIVIICSGDRPGMGLLNAEQFRNPYGAPAIHVSSEAREIVLAGAQRGAEGQVVADNRYVRAKACNVSSRSTGEIGGLRRWS
jgi:hypothetical protein